MKTTIVVAFCWLQLVAVAGGIAQTTERRSIRAAVSYISVNTVYINAGREKGLAVGDTLTVANKGILRGSVAITAVSSNSSAAAILAQQSPIAVGDTAFIEKTIALEKEQPKLEAGVASGGPKLPSDNAISGRVALQYAGAGSFGSRTDFSQPALVVQLDVNRLFGTGMTFRMYGRTYRDLSPQFNLYDPGSSRTKVRMYEMSLSYDQPDDWVGYDVGRVSSRFVGGMGPFDGAQFYVRNKHWSAGALVGTQPDYRTSGVDINQQKAAAFVNYGWGTDVFHSSNVTLAYGQLRYHGKLDRVFAYLQSAIRFTETMSLYESAEFDLKTIENGVEKSTFEPTNAFVSLSYTPVQWLYTSIGYDATRLIYLMQSMSAFPDTLFDKNLRQGFRFNASIRAPLNIVFTGNASYRGREGGSREARTLGGGIRMSDIAHSQVNAGFQYASIRGLYTDGSDYTADLDRWISMLMVVSLRLDRYSYSLLFDGSRNVTTTATLNFNYRLSRSWYTALSLDQIWENKVRNQRVFLELGMHF